MRSPCYSKCMAPSGLGDGISLGMPIRDPLKVSPFFRVRYFALPISRGVIRCPAGLSCSTRSPQHERNPILRRFIMSHCNPRSAYRPIANQPVSGVVRTAIATIAFVASAIPAAAAFPERKITLIVPFAAGGSTDAIARIVADHMAKTLGQSIIIENDAGAGGTTPTRRVAQAAADGYTIMIGTHGHARRRARAISQPQVRSGQGLHADRPDSGTADRDRHEEGFPGQQPHGVRRLR